MCAWQTPDEAVVELTPVADRAGRVLNVLEAAAVDALLFQMALLRNSAYRGMHLLRLVE